MELKRREFLKVAAGLLVARPQLELEHPVELEAWEVALLEPPDYRAMEFTGDAGPLQEFQDLMNATPAVYAEGLGEFLMFEADCDTC